MSAKKSVAKSVAEAGLGSPSPVECMCDTCKHIGERCSVDDLKALYPNCSKHEASVMHYMREFAMKCKPSDPPKLERKAGYYMQSEGLGGASTKKVVSDDADENVLEPADDSFPFMVANFNIYGAADVEECEEEPEQEYDSEAHPGYYRSGYYPHKKRSNYRDPMA